MSRRVASVLNFLKKAVPCTSSGAKHHVEDHIQHIAKVSEVAVASRPVRQEPVKALSPVSPRHQVSRVREATLAPRPVQQGSSKALTPVSPKLHVSKVSESAVAPRPVRVQQGSFKHHHEKAPSPITSRSVPGNGGGPVLNHVEATAPKPAPRPIAQSDPIRAPIPAAVKPVGKHLEATRALGKSTSPFPKINLLTSVH